MLRSPLCAFPQTSGFQRTTREQQKEWKLGYPNSFLKASPLGPAGNPGAPGQPCPRLVGTCLLAPAIGPALAAAPSRRGGEPALARSSSGNRSRSNTPLVPSQPHGDLKTSLANLRKQLFPGSQTAEGKGAGLRKSKSERDPDEKRGYGRAGRLDKSVEEADPPRSEGEAQKPVRELWEERREL